MSFCQMNDVIKEGDTVIVYLSFSQLYQIQVRRGLSHHTKYGALKHADMIGKRYGSRFQCSQGSVYVVQGEPNLWTSSLPHRTQILYTPNISVITLQLELRPGSVVVESGTGSASLSHALIRSVYPHGHLHTFEFHQQRSEAARKEFKDHGLAEYATVYHRDVCNDGFGLVDVADAVFLDLPSPWKALASAKAALKKEGGRICSFSPCIEQVQKSALEMAQLGFTDIYTVESLRRVLSIKKYDLNEFDFNMDAGRAAAASARHEAFQQQQRKHQQQQQPEKTTATTEEAEAVEMSEAVASVSTPLEPAAALNDNKATVEPPAKRADSEAASSPATQSKTTASKQQQMRGKKKRYGNNNNNNKSDDEDEEGSNEDSDAEEAATDAGIIRYTAKPINIQPGHTGFLTFATLLHKDFNS